MHIIEGIKAKLAVLITPYNKPQIIPPTGPLRDDPRTTGMSASSILVPANPRGIPGTVACITRPRVPIIIAKVKRFVVINLAI
jgi:hypothetical protein